MFTPPTNIYLYKHTPPPFEITRNNAASEYIGTNVDITVGADVHSAVVVFLFLAGLWFTEAIINGPNFHPKLTLAAPTIGYSVSYCVSC